MNKTTEKLITKSFRRLLDKGIHRGFITYLELSKSLGKRNLSQGNLEEAILHIFDNKVSLVEKKSDYKVSRKKDSSLSANEKSVETDKSDDPIRMYLREMGGVELLSREGEIAIAKRIEAGKDVMISALSQSPLTANTIFEWKKKLEENQLLVREIIDIDSTYMDIDSEEEEEASDKNKKNEKKVENEKSTKPKKDEKDENNNEESEYSSEDEFNPSLAAMEEEIKPQVISTIDYLCKNYLKLIKYQKEKLDCSLNAKEFSRAKEIGYKKIQNNLMEKIKNLQLNASVLEELVQIHYKEKKKIISLEGILMRAGL